MNGGAMSDRDNGGGKVSSEKTAISDKGNQSAFQLEFNRLYRRDSCLGRHISINNDTIDTREILWCVSEVSRNPKMRLNSATMKASDQLQCYTVKNDDTMSNGGHNVVEQQHQQQLLLQQRQQQ